MPKGMKHRYVICTLLFIIGVDEIIQMQTKM
jgi:hypothetical protein